MHHIHTSIVSRHLATRGNNKILRTPPPHISSSEEILPRLTVIPKFVDRPRQSASTAGQMDREAGWWTTSEKIRLPPLARVMGVGRQQHYKCGKITHCEIKTHYLTLIERQMCVHAHQIWEEYTLVMSKLDYSNGLVYASCVRSSMTYGSETRCMPVVSKAA